MTYLAEIDPLAVGLTRSTAFMGIALHLFFGNTAFGLLSFIYFHSLLSIPLCLSSYLVLLFFSAKDPHFLRLWQLAFLQTGYAKNYRFWGYANSYGAGEC